MFRVKLSIYFKIKNRLHNDETNSMTEHHKIIIIGAGLSGLYTAWRLQKTHSDVLILEARARVGGRILSLQHNNSQFDMGPAWVWPQLQPRLQRLVQKLNLKLFKQFTSGDMLYEKSLAETERFSGQSSHSEFYRIEGGSQSIIDALQTQLSASHIHLNTIVTSIDESQLCVQTLRDGKSFEYSADKIILALPPRLFVQNIKFMPEFSDDVIVAFNNVATWMSSHSKIVFIYDKPFWREKKLSGEVFSHCGPLSEIYDGSPADENFYALTSFVGVAAQQRKQIKTQQLLNVGMAQLQRLFGDESKNVKEVKIQDWAGEEFTTAKLDLTSPMQHPQYAENMPRGFWNGRLILAGTEVAREHGGYLEGALESADEAIMLCDKH